ncbi:MAG: amino acid adenylation domain-containing protein [Rhodoglobus sp.]
MADRNGRKTVTSGGGRTMNCGIAAGGEIWARLHAVALTEPDRLAVIDGDERISFGALLLEAQRIAALIPSDARPLIGLEMGRSWRTIAAMIGVLHAGRAYVPIDPEYPVTRRRQIRDDARLNFLITDEERETQVVAVGDQYLVSHELNADAMYVIYTSGSTGVPKGVVVTQANVISLMDAASTALEMRPGQRWSVFHSFSFDFSVWETWGPLLSGGCAVLFDRATAIEPRLTLDLLEREHVNVLSMVPSAFTGLVHAAATAGRSLPELSCLIFGGEAVRLADVTRWWEAHVSPAAAVVNMYGITETTVHVTYCPLTPAVIASAIPGHTPIGVPLPNAEVLVSVDGGATTCAVGEPGEMIVFGAGVADGYLGRPDLTATKFPDVNGQRCYRSGDWGASTGDGSLVYVGRMDNQVKVRGHRIELGEIDDVLGRHAAVAAVACVVHRDSQRPDRLIAFVVSRDDSLDTRELRRWATRQVPGHLVPTRLVEVQELPITLNGKVDRTALAARAADLFTSP